MGAQKWVDLNRYHTTKSCLEDLKTNGYQIVATTPHAEDCDLIDFDITKKSCFFFGRETEGLSQHVIDNADCSMLQHCYGSQIYNGNLQKPKL